MTAPARRRRRTGHRGRPLGRATLRRRGDAGQVTAFTVVMIAAPMLFAGLVLDGGLALSAKVRALNEAQEAARAGTQALDLTAYRIDGTVVLDRGQAVTAAHRYLARTGNRDAATASVSATDDEVTVTVTRHQPTQILQFAGMSGFTVRASATARAAHGVTAPDP